MTEAARTVVEGGTLLADVNVDWGTVFGLLDTDWDTGLECEVCRLAGGGVAGGDRRGPVELWVGPIGSGIKDREGPG